MPFVELFKWQMQGQFKALDFLAMVSYSRTMEALMSQQRGSK